MAGMCRRQLFAPIHVQVHAAPCHRCSQPLPALLPRPRSLGLCLQTTVPTRPQRTAHIRPTTCLSTTHARLRLYSSTPPDATPPALTALAAPPPAPAPAPTATCRAPTPTARSTCAATQAGPPYPPPLLPASTRGNHCPPSTAAPPSRTLPSRRAAVSGRGLVWGSPPAAGSATWPCHPAGRRPGRATTSCPPHAGGCGPEEAINAKGRTTVIKVCIFALSAVHVYGEQLCGVRKEGCCLACHDTASAGCAARLPYLSTTISYYVGRHSVQAKSYHRTPR